MVIGLEETEYTVVENFGFVEVCTILRMGSLAREVLVTLSTGDRTAVGKCSTVHTFMAVYYNAHYCYYYHYSSV